MTEVWQRPLRSDAERNRRLVLEAAALAFTEDALRPEAATPLPVPPLSYEEIERALAIAADD